jgi:DNA polymerase
MSSAYDQLLDATIQHLENLKAHGVRFVSVSSESLGALAQPAPRQPISTSSSRPAATERERGGREEAQTSKGEISQSLVTSAATIQRPPLAPQSLIRTMKSESVPSTATDLPLALSGEALPSSTVPLSPEAKAVAFAELRQRALACGKCPHLASSRKNVVFGVGSIEAPLMFVGEAPGADEDEQAEPFVGKAGQLLTRIIETMGLKRGDVYIGNILKCRPDTPGQSAGNRKPTPDEMKTCIPYLHEQIDLIRPRVLVALGATAVEGLLGKTIGITKLRGSWKTYRGIPLMPTYHPAYLLRNQAMSEKRKVWEDMLQVMEKLQMPISEKQRRFFLKA